MDQDEKDAVKHVMKDWHRKLRAQGAMPYILLGHTQDATVGILVAPTLDIDPEDQQALANLYVKILRKSVVRDNIESN